jgi:putative pyoverdin transport system ATP-binding/permease protein
MKLFRFILSHFRVPILLAMLAGCFSGAGSAGLITLIHIALTASDSSRTGLSLRFTAICLLAILSTFVAQSILARFAENSAYDLRIRLCEQILATPLRQLEEVGEHRLMVTLKQDVNQLATVLSIIPAIITNTTVVICCLAYLAWLSVKLLILVFLFLLAGVVVNRLLIAKALHYFRLSRAEVDALFKHFQALISGIKEIQLHWPRRRAFMSQTLQPSAKAFRNHNIASTNFHIANLIWSEIVYFFFIGSLLFIVADFKYVENSVLTGYALTILYMMGYIGSIISTAPTLNRATVNLERIEALGLSLSSRAGAAGLAAPPACSPNWRSLELIGVTHRYRRDRDDADFILGPIDLTLKPAELVFITGGNGSGKTTLAKLLCGLYVSESGKIRLNGEVVTEAQREGYRQYFTAIFSDFFLFDSLLGLHAPALDSRAEEYLARLQLDHKVRIEDGVLSTLDLSRGQRKRLALLTAYLEDRPIYIFDEWAADQDPAFKEIFYREMLPELRSRGKTVVVISHDDRYYDLADRLIKLDYGKIVPYLEDFNPKVMIPMGNSKLDSAM